MSSKYFYVVDAERASRVELIGWAREQGFSARAFLSGDDLLDELPHLVCGVILIDLLNTGADSFDLIATVAKTKPACPIIAMTAAADTRVAVEALKRGAVDFLAKPVGPSELHEAMAAAAAILEQRRELSEHVESDGAALSRLTSREREVLAAMAGGNTSKATAVEMAISVRTVEAHRSALIDKLGVATAAAAIAVAVRYETALLAHGSRISIAHGR